MTEEPSFLFNRIISIWGLCEIALVLLVSFLVLSNLQFIARILTAIVLPGIVLFDYLFDEERSFGVRDCFSDLWNQRSSILFLLLVLQPLIMILVLQVRYQPWLEPLGDVGAYLGLVFLGPIVEELMFRFGLQERLTEHIPTNNAIIISSIAFAACHWVWINPILVLIEFVAHFLKSIVFGFIYSNTRHLIPSLLTHMGVNVFAACFRLV